MQNIESAPQQNENSAEGVMMRHQVDLMKELYESKMNVTGTTVEGELTNEQQAEAAHVWKEEKY